MEFVETRHGPLAYLRAGQGRPFVLLHGNSMTAASQERLAQRFTDEHEVYSVDLLGHGSSARPAQLFSPDYFSMQGEALADLLAALFPAQAVPVFGMSAGGVTALNAACEQPERIAALILDSVFVSVGASTVAAHQENIDTMVPTWEQYMRKQHGEEWWPQLSAGLLYMVMQLEAIGESVIPCLGQIELPTLIFQGGRDPYSSAEQGRMIAEAVPGARLVFDPEGGHIFSWRDPDTFREQVRAFLDGLA